MQTRMPERDKMPELYFKRSTTLTVLNSVQNIIPHVYYLSLCTKSILFSFGVIM